MAPSGPRAKRSGPRKLYSSFPRDVFWPEQDKCVAREAHITAPGHDRSHSSDFLKKKAAINWVESALQVHGLEAQFSVVVVFPEPSSDGVDGGFTAVLGSEPQSCRRYRVMSSDTAASRAFAMGRRRVSPTATGW